MFPLKFCIGNFEQTKRGRAHYELGPMFSRGFQQGCATFVPLCDLEFICAVGADLDLDAKQIEVRRKQDEGTQPKGTGYGDRTTTQSQNAIWQN